MTPDPRAGLRVLGAVVGLLASYADGLERGRPVTAAQLRELVERLCDANAALWDRLLVGGRNADPFSPGGGRVMNPGQQPPRYRRWTEAEAVELADAVRGGRKAVCPIDGDEVELSQADTVRPAPVRFIICPTCRNRHTLSA